MKYTDLLESKIVLAKDSGIKIDTSEINPILYPHQRDIVRWAAIGGRRAIFASFGLGKTFMQIELCRLIQKHSGGKTLIICPLGVKQEFTEDARKLGVEIEYVRTDSEVENAKTPFLITNYELMYRDWETR